MDSSFFVKLILENQCDQRKFQSMMEMRMAQKELNRAHSEKIVQMVTQHWRNMENFLNASLSHLHQVTGLPSPPALLAPIGQTPLQLMPTANLGKSSEVYEQPHSSAIGSQWMTEKDSKEEKEADATILKVLSNIAAEETNKEDPLVATANSSENPAPATSEGSRAADPAPAPARGKAFLLLLLVPRKALQLQLLLLLPKKALLLLLPLPQKALLLLHLLLLPQKALLLLLLLQLRLLMTLFTIMLH
jgi:hypothetical protein